MDDANDIAPQVGAPIASEGSSSADIDSLFARARVAYETGDLISAHAEYRAILERRPHHGDALHILGAITRELGRAHEGAELVREAIHHDPCNAAYHNTLGNFLVEDGRFETALECFRQAVAVNPSLFAAHGNLGRVLQRMGRLSEAVPAYWQALELRPDNAEIRANLGNALATLGQIDEAEPHLVEATRLDPTLGAAWINLGLLREQQHRPDEAMACYRQATEDAPREPKVHVMMARLLAAQGKPDEAAAAYAQAIRLDPTRTDARLALAEMFHADGRPGDAAEQVAALLQHRPNDVALLGRHAELLIEAGDGEGAERALARAIELAPGDCALWMRLGALLREQDRADEAVPIYQSVLALDPDSADAHCELGIAEIQRGQAGDAALRFRRAIELRPDHAEAHNNLANLMQELGGHDEAIEAYRRALACRPEFAEAHYNLGQILLLLARYVDGWHQYEWRLRIEGARPAADELSTWNGEPLKGHQVCLVTEQGPGDVVMFAHCLPDLLDDAAQVSLHTEHRLAPLFARSFPDIEVTTQRPEPADAGAALTLAIGSLPGLYRPNEASFTNRRARYLRPDPSAVDRWRERYDALGGGLTVGLSWRGGKTVTEKRLRRTALEDWLPILRLPDVQFVNLQYGDCREEIDHARESWGIDIAEWDDTDPMHDLDGFAAQIDALDGVISIANTTAHFAGALGKPTRLLVPAAPSWRWQLERADSPWYPDLTLYRQNPGERWAETLRRVAGEIDAALTESATPAPALPASSRPASSRPASSRPAASRSARAAL